MADDKNSGSVANIFAFGSPDPGLVNRAHSRLERHYDVVWRPASGWVFAIRSIGWSEPCQNPTGSILQAEASRPITADETVKGLLARPGDFTFVFLGSGGKVHAARSAAGLVPLYFWQGPDRLVFSTQADAIPDFGGWRGGLEPLSNAIWVMGWGGNLSNRSHLAGVRSLAVGETVTFASPDTAAAITRYWCPQPLEPPLRPDSKLARSRQGRVRALLLDSLSKSLDPQGANLLSLSGGVDSGVLLSLATQKLGFQIMTWSQLPPEGVATRDREIGFVRPLRTWAGVSRFWEDDLTPDSFEALIQQAPPISFPVIHPALCSLATITREQQVRVLLGGEFADEVCGSRLSTPDWAAGTALSELLSEPSAWPFGRSAPARWLKGRVLAAIGRPYVMHPDGLLEFVPEELKREYQDELARMRRWVNGLPAAHRYMFTRHVTNDFAAMNWEACSHYGIRRVFPFLSRDVIELAMECHPSELIGPGTKRLLRGAVHEDVPHATLYRQDKGNFGLRFDKLRRPIGDLQLDDEKTWAPLENMVSPQWRKTTMRRGWMGYNEKCGLLYLIRGQRNLEAALTRAGAPDV
ncbi:MAG TPA: asparagine synthetase B family protein [Verrucomicrobiae bacterium]|nr:asparagine synthetase B family protein [Verrucomicrobiae bacterium]